MRHQMAEIGFTVVVFHRHRRGEIAQQRGHRRRRHVDKDKALLRLLEREHARDFSGPPLPACGQATTAACGQATTRPAGGLAVNCFALQYHRQVASVRSHQPQRERNMERQLGLLPRRGRAGLLQREDIAPGHRVVFALRLDHRRARLLVPAAELGEVDPARVLHRLHKIVGGHRLAVMTLEVQVHAGAKRPRPEQGVLHAHQFGALLVHRHGVEIADLHVSGRAHRVRHRSRVLGKLRCTQAARFLDALHHTRIHIGAVLLVAEHGQAFFQR